MGWETTDPKKLALEEEYDEDEEPVAALPRIGRRVLLGLMIFRGAIAAAVVGLLGRLWGLQVVEGSAFQKMAEGNHLRTVLVEAPRGVAYDRRKRLLVRNVPSFSVAVTPADLRENQESAVFEALAGALKMSAAEIRRLVQAGRPAPFTPVTIKKNVDRAIALTLEERLDVLPGVQVLRRPIRHYLHGNLTSHVLGYMGAVPADALKRYEAQGYDQNDRIGISGIEAAVEKELRGTKGTKQVEVDAAGREVRVLQGTEPRPGHNLILSLDLDLQQEVASALAAGMAEAKSKSAVAVAMDPRSGELLAMVSLPDYDNNLFAGGILAKDYETLINDPGKPLVNYAITGLYPPGSTFKLITSSAALQEQVVNLSTIRRCAGTLVIPDKYDPRTSWNFYCWNRGGHGSVNIIEAIAQSCDIYFYQVAGGYTDFRGLGIEKLAEYSRLYGLGERSGIDLPGESAGLVPDEEWKLNLPSNTYKIPWLTGDTYNMSIGQADLLVTPLQMCNWTATVANGGTLYRPQVVREVQDASGRVVRQFSKQVIRQVSVSSANLTLIRQGMHEAVTRGSAYAAKIAGMEVCGKTGTAEFPGPRDKDGYLPTHAWFTCFAPYEAPEVAVTVLVAGGGEGSKVSAPIAKRILEYYFRNYQERGMSLPPAPVPTATAPAEKKP